MSFLRNDQQLDYALGAFFRRSGMPINFAARRYDPSALRVSDPRYSALTATARFYQWKTKRQASYLAGRLAAQDVLQAVGINDFVVDRGAFGEPLWPPGVSGSITHTCTFALAIASRQDHTLLGVDIEEPVPDTLAGNVFLSTKEQTLLPHRSTERQRLLSAIFSAKETIFKALFPTLKTYFGFDAVTLCDHRSDSMHFTISPQFAERFCIQPANLIIEVPFTTVSTLNAPPLVVTWTALTIGRTCGVIEVEPYSVSA